MHCKGVQPEENKRMRQPVYKGLPLLSPSANSFSEHTHTAWGSSGAITKTSHNSPFFLPLRGCGSDDDGNDDNDNPNLQSF